MDRETMMGARRLLTISMITALLCTPSAVAQQDEETDTVSTSAAAVEATTTARIESTYEAGDPGDYRLGVEPLADPRLAPAVLTIGGEPLAVAEVEPVATAVEPPPASDPALAVPAAASGELGFSFTDWFGRAP
ncbi:MAG TPA: hypothetical protein QF813_04235 [Alphaproteobacteria bacterium]|jgi:hypothetical protein|nr:hypothetical protein [Alphaproteobacteria bacterium]